MNGRVKTTMEYFWDLPGDLRDMAETLDEASAILQDALSALRSVADQLRHQDTIHPVLREQVFEAVAALDAQSEKKWEAGP